MSVASFKATKVLVLTSRFWKARAALRTRIPRVRETELLLQSDVIVVTELRHRSGGVVPMVLELCVMPVVYVCYLNLISF